MHYVESGQIASPSCWLLAAARIRVENTQLFGSRPPFNGKLEQSTSDSLRGRQVITRFRSYTEITYASVGGSPSPTTIVDKLRGSELYV